VSWTLFQRRPIPLQARRDSRPALITVFGPGLLYGRRYPGPAFRGPGTSRKPAVHPAAAVVPRLGLARMPVATAGAAQPPAAVVNNGRRRNAAFARAGTVSARASLRPHLSTRAAALCPSSGSWLPAKDFRLSLLRLDCLGAEQRPELRLSHAHTGPRRRPPGPHRGDWCPSPPGGARRSQSRRTQAVVALSVGLLVHEGPARGGIYLDGTGAGLG
jgi:hypothetical protein